MEPRAVCARCARARHAIAERRQTNKTMHKIFILRIPHMLLRSCVFFARNVCSSISRVYYRYTPVKVYHSKRNLRTLIIMHSEFIPFLRLVVMEHKTDEQQRRCSVRARYCTVCYQYDDQSVDPCICLCRVCLLNCAKK